MTDELLDASALAGGVWRRLSPTTPVERAEYPRPAKVGSA